MDIPPIAPEVWARLLEQRRRPDVALAAAAAAAIAAGGPLAGLYRELIAAGSAAPLTIAQVGQSLDGRIATATGHSQYINGAASLDHLHRLRALVDAVVVGASTVAIDDPRLTTRRVAGDSPIRVIIDPRGRLPATARLFDGEAPALVITAAVAGRPVHPAAAAGVPVIAVAAVAGRLPPSAILAQLHARGLTRVLVEGGGFTVSAFLDAGCVDRLHVAVAPMLIGSGTPAITLPPIARIDEAMPLRMTAYPLGGDVLFDCRLGRG